MRRAVVLVAALATVGVVGFLVTRSSDEAPPQAVVRIEAPDEVCWDAQLNTHRAKALRRMLPWSRTAAGTTPLTWAQGGQRVWW
ncbi:MAG TPA: hypothetical protein VK988_03970 [Acidimicrobiales bacterium]|nr:hypothetical protein [Acidimicrobiales bacterium]